MPVITCIEDLKRLHKAHTPRMFYDYAESGSYTEQTFRENTTDFAQIRLRQKVAVDMSGRTLASDMVGLPVTMPVGLAPVGLTGMQRADGEIKAARAAEKFGVPFCLSTMSICSIEDVAAHTEKPFMFQLYVMKDQEFLEGIIGRAKAAGCSALVLTLDLQILGQRHKDLKNGLSAPSSSIRVLPEIVAAVGDQVEIHLDSGIRSGQDVLKALALGAHATWIGRAFIHGLGAMGEKGVTTALEVIRKELDTTMALCGERDIRQVGRHNVMVPANWATDYA